MPAMKAMRRTGSTLQEVKELAKVGIAAPDLSNLGACIDDVVDAARDNDSGPSNTTDFSTLRGRLEGARRNLPALYQSVMADPYIATLDDIGAAGFTTIIARDPNLQSTAGLMFDISQAILQHGEDYLGAATGAYQEVISDLYDGFLSAEDRRGVKPPDLGVVAPLAKWGNPDFGPYTWPIDATRIFGCEAAVVSLPPANARKGLLAWSALGHEVGGHDLLHADIGLIAELTDKVFLGIKDATGDESLAEYFADRIDETGSDVLGILNMGPVAAIGLIGYFRGLNKAFGGEAKLRTDGPAGDVHPSDITRGYLGADVVGLLRFSQAAAWSGAIAEETDRDLPKSGEINLAGQDFDVAAVRRATGAIARTMVRTRMASLDNHAFGRIQNWKNQDEQIVADLQTALLQPGTALSVTGGFYAAHVVAAATMCALRGAADLGTLQGRMIAILKTMHTANSSWGPLNVRHPGDLVRHRVYERV